jgi:hypothetical protein
MPVTMQLGTEELLRLVTEEFESKGYKVCPKSDLEISIDEDLGTGSVAVLCCGGGFSCPCDEAAQAKRAKMDRANRLGKESEYVPSGEAVLVSDIFGNDEEDDLAGFE